MKKEGEKKDRLYVEEPYKSNCQFLANRSNILVSAEKYPKGKDMTPQCTPSCLPDTPTGNSQSYFTALLIVSPVSVLRAGDVIFLHRKPPEERDNQHQQTENQKVRKSLWTQLGEALANFYEELSWVDCFRDWRHLLEFFSSKTYIPRGGVVVSPVT